VTGRPRRGHCSDGSRRPRVLRPGCRRKPPVVEQVDLFEGGDLDQFSGRPGPAWPDQFDVEQADHRLGQGVIQRRQLRLFAPVRSGTWGDAPVPSVIWDGVSVRAIRQKYEMVRRVRADGQPVAREASFGFSLGRRSTRPPPRSTRIAGGADAGPARTAASAQTHRRGHRIRPPDAGG
jgi:hypothetical protein